MRVDVVLAHHGESTARSRGAAQKDLAQRVVAVDGNVTAHDASAGLRLAVERVLEVLEGVEAVGFSARAAANVQIPGTGYGDQKDARAPGERTALHGPTTRQAPFQPGLSKRGRSHALRPEGGRSNRRFACETCLLLAAARRTMGQRGDVAGPGPPRRSAASSPGQSPYDLESHQKKVEKLNPSPVIPCDTRAIRRR